MKAFDEFLAQYFPEGDRADDRVMFGYNLAQTLVQVLRQCGNNLTRENVMKEAANLRNFRTTNLLRHRDQYQSCRFFADQGAAQEIQGRNMGALRFRTQQRELMIN